MLTLYYWPGASSVIPHIALEELGAPYERKLINLAKGEHKSDEADTPCIELLPAPSRPWAGASSTARPRRPVV